MKYLFKFGILVLFVCSLVACAPTSNSPDVNKSLVNQEAGLQKELAVKQTFSLNQRLMNVAAPIMMANTQLCGKLTAAYLGVQFSTEDILAKDLRPTVAKLYGVKENPTAVIIADNSPANGLLEVGDVITHWNGKSVPKGKKGLKFISKSLKDQKTTSPITLHVQRKGVTTSAALTPAIACDSPVGLADTNEINAAANGKSITVTRGMMRFVNSDDELAAVIGHELAHNSRRHIQAKQTNAVVGTILGAAVSVAIGVDVTRIGTAAGAAAHSHGFETEADYVGLYHAARAGYDISAAPELWRRMSAAHPQSIGFKGGSHPSNAKRAITLGSTVEEINAKREAGLPLIPEEKKAKKLSTEKTS